ncbi:transglycosylase [Aquabacterium fontiphilum]|nr:MltA domain-containing protein [Aquabacterium fontiphilum]NBD21708.1 transglycosylase [Aquabacterium fontiphilum]
MASSTINHMTSVDLSSNGLAGLRRFAGLAAMLAIVGMLHGCGSMMPPPPPPELPRTAPAPVPAPAPSASSTTVQRPKSQWVAVDWQDLPGWDIDAAGDWWPALHRGCVRPAAAWQGLCAEVRRLGSDWGAKVGDGFVRQWLQSQLRPWRVVGLEGQPTGLLTGYFEPLLDGRRQPGGRHIHPLYRAPADLQTRRPHYTRAEVETLPEARAAVLGREIVYLADPLDVLLIQVQGSGRIRLLDEPDARGQPRVVRMAFGGHNDQPYVSVARWLVDQGAFTLEQASWQAIRAWADQNPGRVAEMMRANPRMVYFREEALTDPEAGPSGAQGVPLTPTRSIAVDRDSIPLGTPVWLDSTLPQPWTAVAQAPRPLRRLVMAQDTGGAILGAVRADFFWGWGDDALASAGRTKQPLAMWALWPAGSMPPGQLR